MTGINEFVGAVVGFSLLYIGIGVIDNLSTYLFDGDRLSNRISGWTV